jgi:hypothetical protein
MPAPRTSSPSARPASEAIRPALAELVAAELRAGARGPAADRRPAERDRHLRAVCRVAHDAGVPVERVLVLLKAELARAAADRPAVALRRLEERLAGLISACIATYYRAD